MNIIFAGTPEFAARHLNALLDTNHTIVAVYTQPDRPSGRGKKLTASPVKQLAVDNDLAVFQPVSLKSDTAQAELAAHHADVMVVVAYGLLLPKAVLEIPAHGCINVHGSILPRWRGAAPIQRAIEAGDTQSGVTIMQMDVGLDTGDMLLKTYCDINDHDTSTDLHDKLADIGPPALIETLAQISTGTLQPEKQDDNLSNYAKKIEKSEAEINWQEPAAIIERKIRAFNPFPICYTWLGGERLRIHRARIADGAVRSTPGTFAADSDSFIVYCGEGAIALETIQLPGKKSVSTADFLKGFTHLLASNRFDDAPV